MTTFNKIIEPVATERGAPMGRPSDSGTPPKDKAIFDRAVPLVQGYDKGGAYWGYPNNLRVRYTKDLAYVEFYRGRKRPKPKRAKQKPFYVILEVINLLYDVEFSITGSKEPESIMKKVASKMHIPEGETKIYIFETKVAKKFAFNFGINKEPDFTIDR